MSFIQALNAIAKGRRSGPETPKRSLLAAVTAHPLTLCKTGTIDRQSSNINSRLNLTYRRSSRIDLARRNLEDRFFCLAEHGAKRSALAKPKRAGGFRFSTQEYQYRTVHCNEAVAVCLSFGAAGRIPCDFQCDFDKCALWRLLDVGMSRYRRMRRAGRLDWILPLYGFAEHSRRSTSARGIMIRPH